MSREIIGLCERLDKWSTAYGASRTTEARFRFHHPLPLIYPHQPLGDSILTSSALAVSLSVVVATRRLRYDDAFSPRETGSSLRSGAPLFTFPIKTTRESIHGPGFLISNHEHADFILETIATAIRQTSSSPPPPRKTFLRFLVDQENALVFPPPPTLFTAVSRQIYVSIPLA